MLRDLTLGSSAPQSTPQESLRSLTSSRSTVTDCKFKVEKFKKTNNFNMWQSKVVDVVFQQDLQMVLEKDKLVEMMEVKW